MKNPKIHPSYLSILGTWINGDITNCFRQYPDPLIDYNDRASGYVSLTQLKEKGYIPSLDYFTPNDEEMNILNKIITEIKASDHNFTDDELKNIKLMPFVTQGTLTTLMAGSGIAYDFHLQLLNKSHSVLLQFSTSIKS